MLTGFLCVPLFKFGVPLIPHWGPLVSQIEEMAPSFLLAMVTGVVATLVTTARAERVDP